MPNNPRKKSGRSRLASMFLGGAAGAPSGALTQNPEYGKEQGDIDPNNTVPAEQQQAFQGGRSPIAKIFLGPNAADVANNQAALQGVQLQQQAAAQLKNAPLLADINNKAAAALYEKQQGIDLGNLPARESIIGNHKTSAALAQSAGILKQQNEQDKLLEDKQLGHITKLLFRNAPLPPAPPEIQRGIAEDYATRLGSKKIADMGFDTAESLGEVAKLATDTTLHPDYRTAYLKGKTAEALTPDVDNKKKAYLQLGNNSLWNMDTNDLLTGPSQRAVSTLVDNVFIDPKTKEPVRLGKTKIDELRDTPATNSLLPTQASEKARVEKDAAAIDASSQAASVLGRLGLNAPKPWAASELLTPQLPPAQSEIQTAPLAPAAPEATKKSIPLELLQGAFKALQSHGDSKSKTAAMENMQQSMLRLGGVRPRAAQQVGSSIVSKGEEAIPEAFQRAMKNPEFADLINKLPPEIQAGILKLALTVGNQPLPASAPGR